MCTIRGGNALDMDRRGHVGLSQPSQTTSGRCRRLPLTSCGPIDGGVREVRTPLQDACVDAWADRGGIGDVSEVRIEVAMVDHVQQGPLQVLHRLRWVCDNPEIPQERANHRPRRAPQGEVVVQVLGHEALLVPPMEARRDRVLAYDRGHACGQLRSQDVRVTAASLAVVLVLCPRLVIVTEQVVQVRVMHHTAPNLRFRRNLLRQPIHR
mmetsp:Transcript_86902/g.251033  ORF Transcript_86902/g.251033 Transcript_86902/m.251033 type:complete len:210 (-) Transcript_86902:909-1538(-)